MKLVGQNAAQKSTIDSNSVLVVLNSGYINQKKDLI